MINWLNNTYLLVAKQAENNSFAIYDTFMDLNQMHTALDYTGKKVLRYQLTVSGSNFSYSLKDEVLIPDNPRRIVS